MPVEFIADIGANHLQNLDRVKQLIHTAARIGCHAVKFQLYKAKELWSYPKQRRAFRTWELPDSFIPTIEQECSAAGIAFHCTPFSLDAVAFLGPHVDAFKIGAYEILWLDLMKECCKWGIPLAISTGNARTEEILKAVATITKIIPKNILTLYHGHPTYPSDPVHCGLFSIVNLLIHRTQHVGWSDHTRKPGVVHAAIGRGATRIELHLDLDGMGVEYKVGHCWLPDEVEQLIKDVREGEAANGVSHRIATNLLEQRTDPVDGMRPLSPYREKYKEAK